MQSRDVLSIYNLLKTNGVATWIDGGWCVDALVGEQVREHDDLDLAISRTDNAKLRQILELQGYKEEKRHDSSGWMYVLKQGDSEIDVHVFQYDDAGNNIYGVEYPFRSLTGIGTIHGQEVNCIAPEWMFKFKTAYEPKEKDIKDLRALSKKFGFELPVQYKAS